MIVKTNTKLEPKAMGIVGVKSELDLATRHLNENLHRHLDQRKDASAYNLNLALVHICRAIEKIARDVDSLESRA